MQIALIGYEANVKNRVGSNQYAFELIKALYALDKKNKYVVYLPSLPLHDLPKEKENWQYKIVGPARFWNVFGLPRALFRQQPRPNVIFNPGHYCPLFSPASLIVSIMDLGYLHFPGQFTKPTYWKLKFWTEISIKKATHIFSISERTKNDIMKIYPVSEEKITVTYPGYDEKKFRVESSRLKVEKIKKKYGIQGDYILFLGTLKPSKNVEGLIEAFKHITYHISHITLVVAGKKGWMFEGIFEKVKELGLEKKVIFTDFVSEEEVPSLILGAEVFVMPSFWEGFGIPVLEAMASGVPVVVSNVGSLPEVVGKAGIVVYPYKTEEIVRGIERALKERAELKKKGLAQVKKFSWEKCARQTLEVLEKISRA